ncbi:hypothetical protein K439DRAFT_1077103 [Ramaria rubella]|nr:hypothetical protein K439DRAFT_1077103 [Ramaria rubella]
MLLQTLLILLSPVSLEIFTLLMLTRYQVTISTLAGAFMLPIEATLVSRLLLDLAEVSQTETDEETSQQLTSFPLADAVPFVIHSSHSTGTTPVDVRSWFNEELSRRDEQRWEVHQNKEVDVAEIEVSGPYYYRSRTGGMG